MRILVTGADGMLGQALVPELRRRGHQVRAGTRHDVDITDHRAVSAAAEDTDWIVNAAAYTAVDRAESDEPAAFLVNAVGPAVLARAAEKVRARLLQVSTDYVFDGRASAPYREDSAPAPICAYGRTKAAGEWAARAESTDAVVVRTSWLYGPGGDNFVSTMARLATGGAPLRVVDDQRGQPTTTRHLAHFLGDIVDDNCPPGILHGTCQGETTWWGLARSVLARLGHDPDRVIPCGSEEYPRPAPRPAYSVLGHDRSRALGLTLLPHWETALDAVIGDLSIPP